MKAVVQAFTLMALLGACGAAMADESPTEVASKQAGAKDCRFAIPDGWNRLSLKWEGGCSGGKADGKGALRATLNGNVDRMFFGSMLAGDLSLGVVETPDGFIAGKFKNGRVIDTSEPSEIGKAFEEASAAAQVVSEHFKKLGKTASANFYAEKAKKLANQME